MGKPAAYRHLTCTGNSRYGSGDGSEYASITEDDFKKHFGYIPRSDRERFLMAEQLLARDRRGNR